MSALPADTDAKSMLEETEFPATEVMKCPFAYYAALRKEAPIFKPPGREEFVVSRYEDIFAITMNREVFSNHSSVFENGYVRSGTLEDHVNPDVAWGIGNSDPPDHTWKRKAGFEMFKPGVLRSYEPMITRYVDELMDDFIENGEVEFVTQFAARLPTKVILDIFGLPQSDMDRAMRWSAFDGMGTRYNSKEVQDKARVALLDLGAYLREVLIERIEKPGNDALSTYLGGRMKLHAELDMPQLLSEASMLFAGGIITTSHLIASMMKLLVENPEQMDRVRGDHALLRRAVEETLRIESPVQFSPRLVLKDTEVGGVHMPAGSICLLVWGSANRDEDRFEKAEAFDIDRQNAKAHMAFGNGFHFCLGAPLARMEAQLAFERILTRMRHIRFAEGKNDFALQPTVTFRAPKSLHLTFERA